MNPHYDKYVQDKIDEAIAEKERIIAEKERIIAEKERIIAEIDKKKLEILIYCIKSEKFSDEQLKQLFKISDEKFNKIKAEL